MTLSGSPRNRLQLWLFFICSFTFTSIYWMLLSFLPERLKELGIANQDIGLVVGIYSASALLLVLPLGLLSDGISPKRILLLGGVATWSHILGLQLAAETWQFLLLASLGGLGWASFQVVLYALYLKVISAEGRGRKIGLFHAGQFLGFGFGPMLAGALWDRMAYSQALFFALAAAILLNVCLIGLPDSAPISFDWKGYRKDLTQGKAILFLGIYFLFATHYGVEQTSHTLFMRRELAFTSEEIGLSYFATGIWMGFLAPIAGYRFDLKRNLFQLLAFGLFCSGAFQMGTAWVHDLSGMIILRLLHTLGDTPVILAFGIMSAEFFPKGRMGGNFAVVYAVRILGSFAGSVIAGSTANIVGYGGTFLYNGIFLLIATCCILPLMQKRLIPVAKPV